jgi:hypothetical protein
MRVAFPGPVAPDLQPLPPGKEAAAGHTQLPAKLSHRKTIRQLTGKQNPLGGNCSLAKYAVASLKHPSPS